MEVYFGHHNVKIKMMKILEVYQNHTTLVPRYKLSNGTIGILIETVWGQMFHFWNFSQNTLSPLENACTWYLF
jgi:hypothetical protein